MSFARRLPLLRRRFRVTDVDTHTVEPQIESLAQRYVRLREERDRADAEFRAVQDELITAIRETGDNKAESNGKIYTVVAAERTKVDADLLRALVPATVFEEIVDYSVPSRKLAAAISSGLVDPEVVSEAVKIYTASPYISISSAQEA